MILNLLVSVQIVAIENVFIKKKKKIYLFGLCVHNRLDLMNNQGLVAKKKKRMNPYGAPIIYQLLHICDCI